MKTLPQIIDWLKTSNKVRVILVEVYNVKVEGSPTTLYLSNVPYMDNVTDKYYDPVLTGGVSFSESLNLGENNYSLSYGDLEIINVSGSKDIWLDYIWTNREISIFIGDATWPRVDFRPIFKGVVSDVMSRDLDTLNIVLLDTLDKLNKPISETIIPSTDANLNTDTLIPVVFGECFNVAPLLTNSIPNSLEYQVHNGPIESIIEVRDNGAPVSITPNVSAGKFSLNQAKFGEITCSVQGAKIGGVYNNTIADVIKSIINYSGNILPIDTTNFNNVASTKPYPVGVYCTSRENILDICNQIAASGGLQLVYSNGLLKLIEVDPTADNGTSYTITPEDIEQNSLHISNRFPVESTTKLAFCKNWSVQESGLAAGLPANAQQQHSTEFIFAYNTDSISQADNLTVGEPEQEEVLLISYVGANAEAARRTNLRKVSRHVYSMVGFSHLLPLELGDRITLINSRFGMQTGKTGIVYSLEKDWLAGTVGIGVLI